MKKIVLFLTFLSTVGIAFAANATNYGDGNLCKKGGECKSACCKTVDGKMVCDKKDAACCSKDAKAECKKGDSKSCCQKKAKKEEAPKNK